MGDELRAGVMRVDITPPIGLTMAGYGGRDRPAEGIREPLSAIALAFEQGDRRCALVTADLIGIPRAVADKVRERVAALCELSAADVFVSATHTHWGPALSPSGYLPVHLQKTISPEYVADTALRLAGAVVQAWNSREPVLARAGTGEADRVSFCRRPVGSDGKVVMQLTMAPEAALAACEAGSRLARTWIAGGPAGERLSEPLALLGGARAGVSDTALPVLELRRADGTPLAVHFAFGCHAVCGAGEEAFYQYSPDWPGYARQAVERLVGCPALVMAGCCGDQVPRVRQGDARERIGQSIGAEAVRVCRLLDGPPVGPLGVAAGTIRIPVRDDLPTVEEARAALAAKSDPTGTGAVTERQLLAMAEACEGLEFQEYEVWAMGLGAEWGLVGLPGEIFEEIGLQIRQRSPFTHTAVVELALDSPGYFPTDAARDEGGYEPTWSTAGKGAEAVLVEGALAVLEAARKNQPA